MPNPLKMTAIPDRAEDEREQHERVQEYLDRLCAPLVGILPYGTRQEIRLEAEGHLCALAQEQAEAGHSLIDATERALARYGAPHTIGQSIVDSWLTGAGSHTKPCAYMMTATMRAFACFSTPTALSLLLIESAVFAGVRTDAFPWLAAWLLAAPLLAGAASGWIVPARSAQAVRNASLLLLLPTTIAAALLLPELHGFYFAAFQLFYGLPAGALSAYLAEAFHLQLRRTKFRAVISR